MTCLRVSFTLMFSAKVRIPAAMLCVHISYCKSLTTPLDQVGHQDCPNIGGRYTKPEDRGVKWHRLWG
jgi:hypothetical protein